MAESGWVLMGKVVGLHGIRGWVKVFSHAEPRSGIIDYDPLYLNINGEWRPVEVQEGRVQGKGVVFKFSGYDDRNKAAALLGCDIAVRCEQLPPLAPDEYYWRDLEGLRVVTVDGVELGTVKRLFETGANDVVVVAGERERLIPFVRGEVITNIDLEQGVIQVDWDPAF